MILGILMIVCLICCFVGYIGKTISILTKNDKFFNIWNNILNISMIIYLVIFLIICIIVFLK
jgi:hypothetical protein